MRAVALLLTVAVVYAGICLFWPIRACRNCDGSGKWRAPLGPAAWRPCRKCSGTGRKVRIGARLMGRKL